MSTIFFRLLQHDDKPEALAEAVAWLHPVGRPRTLIRSIPNPLSKSLVRRSPIG